MRMEGIKFREYFSSLAIPLGAVVIVEILNISLNVVKYHLYC